MQEEILVKGLTLDQFKSPIADTISQKVQEALRKQKLDELKGKFISPTGLCSMFHPKITRQTIHNWAEKGFLTRRKIAGKVYYSYSEVIEAVKKQNKYALKT
jgi:hypothetical protein